MSDRPSSRRATFEALYSERGDPWNLGSEYERAKRVATIAALGGRNFANILEIGCGTGALTAELVPHCERIVALDLSQTALETARENLGDDARISFVRGEVPTDWPDGTFDAVILAEVLYFLSPDEIARVSRLAREALPPGGGTALLVNWTGENDCAVDGDAAVEIFEQAAGWKAELRLRLETYRVDRFDT